MHCLDKYTQICYTYNAENARIRNLCGESETTYAYDNNAKLSRLLVKTTDGRVTKYVYGRGLIGEETNGSFKTYHFDYRGSTVAITDINGNITDTFEYDTYGKLTGRTGSSDIIFLYNGRDGVVTDGNGLIYMRARYYAPELRRFINADILAGDIANGITLNRYAYANANPVSLIDPRGLAADSARGAVTTPLSFTTDSANAILELIPAILGPFASVDDAIKLGVDLAIFTWLCFISPNLAIDYIVFRISGLTKEEHYNRNQNNVEFPDKVDASDFEAGGFFEGWNTGVDASCHQFTSPDKTNVKVVSDDGSYEVIYDSDGNEVTDPRDVGTYNFASPTGDPIGHGMKDVLPWIVWGNSPDDTTTWEQRAAAFLSPIM